MDNLIVDKPLSSHPLLRKLEGLTYLSGAERHAIAALPVTFRVLNAGEHIIRYRERPRHCCLLLDGWVCRYKLLSGGKRQIQSFHVPGDMPDLSGLYLPVMDHSLGTLTNGTIALIAHDDVATLLKKFPGLAVTLCRETNIDAVVVQQWMTSLGRRNARGRMAHLFCELYLRLKSAGLAMDGRCTLPITQVDMADAVGLSPVHVNRTLQVLRGEGLITLRGPALTITDWAGMARAGEFDAAYLHLERYEPKRPCSSHRPAQLAGGIDGSARGVP